MNAVVLLISLVGAGAECPPTAVVEGSGTSAQELISALTSRGVRVEPAGLPPGDCDVLHVKLTDTENGLRVAIADPWGRSAERTVKSALTAATLIETWARMDLLEGTQNSAQNEKPAMIETPAIETQPFAALPPASEPEAKKDPAPKAAAKTPVKAPAKTNQEAAKPDAGANTAAPDAKEEEHAWMWRIGAETVLNDDDARWLGVMGSICARADIFCIGATARYEQSYRGERGADMLIDVSAPIAFGAFALTPAIGLGGGWTKSPFSQCRGERCKFDLDAQPNVTLLGARAEARLDASLRVFSSLSLQFGVSGTIEPNIGRDFGLHDPVLRAHAGISWGAP